MKSIFLILFLISSAVSFSQPRYLIYFKDKNIRQGETLNKNLPEYTAALNKLTDKAIQRRIKTSGEENIITWEDLPLREDYKAALKNAGIEIIRELNWFNAVSAYLTDDKYNFVSKLPFVEKVERVKAFISRNEEIIDYPFYKSTADELNYGSAFTQVNLSDIPQVHKAGITGEGVLVGLLDTGFDWRDHEALVNRNVTAEHDFIFNDDITADEAEDSPGQHAHGTSVFSVIGGYKDSVLIGPAFNSSYLLAKTEVVGSERRIEEDNYAAAIEWMENLGVDITSSSLGYNEFEDFAYTYQQMNGNTTIVTQAVNIAFDKGVVTVTAAGNEGNTFWRYILAPADAFNIIAVGSVSADNSVAGSSSRGPTSDGRIKPEVVAMGVSVWAASHTSFNAYGFSSGTSLGAPLAAGTAALLLSAYPHLNNTQVRSIILETAGSSSSPDNNRGYGLISAASAVSYPNLQITANGTILHKMFIEENAVNTSSVKLFYAEGNNDFIETSMSYNGSGFTYTMPPIAQGRNVNFYFTYSDSAGQTKREPLENEYSYKEGNLIVSLNISNVPADYVLSQNYPNPFNSGTRIDFVARRNEKAELIVIDAAGQKVKVLFNGPAEEGVNTVTWDGWSDRGYSCASGVYYYLLKLEGNEYGKKMILLK